MADTKMPDLGVNATVVWNDEGPTRLNESEHTHRYVSVFPGRSEESFSEAGYKALKAASVDNMVLPMDSSYMDEVEVSDIDVVSSYTLHVALYALQNPTPENIKRALYKIAHSGDCEECYDHENETVQPVPPPPDWDGWVPGDESSR